MKKASVVAAAASRQRTLDVHHMQREAELDEVERELREVSARLGEVERELGEAACVDVIALIRLKDERVQLADRAAQLTARGDQTDYLTDTAAILFRYYDVVDRGGGSAPQPAASATAARQGARAPPAATGARSILSYLAKQEETAAAAPAVAAAAAPPPPQSEDRGSLLDKYMSRVDHNHIRPCAHVEQVCTFCGSSDVSTLTTDAVIVCNTCHTTEPLLIDHEKPSYKDPKKEVSYFAYKRINHFNEWLNQAQGKETTDIPEEVFDKILFEIGKRRITNMAELTEAKIRAILKTLKLNKYYEHSSNLVCRLNGIPSMQMPPELEDKLRTMFKMIQSPFMRHAPTARKNFLSYSFVIHKLLQLLEKDEYLPHFRLLRSREKLWQQDQIWQKICKDLNWQFIASL